MKKLLAYIPAALLLAAPFFGASAATLTGLNVGANVTGAATTVTGASVTTGTSDTNSSGVNASTSTTATPSVHVGTTNNSTAANSDATQVMTSDDLQTYSKGLMQNDSNVDNVSLSSNQIQVGYKEPGHMLGIFPVNMTVKANVDANGNVTLSYPWYHFMMSDTTKADLDASIKSTIASDSWFQTEKSQNPNGTLSAAAQARLAADVESAMKGASNK